MIGKIDDAKVKAKKRSEAKPKSESTADEGSQHVG
jgi:hypothetical protein